MVRSIFLWKDVIREHRTNRVCSVNDMVFSPDSSQLLVAAGRFIHAYSAFDGKLIQTLGNHKDYVTSVAYSADGNVFASGSGDKQVILWESDLHGIFKFSHGDVIRCLSFNPVTHQLASCTSRDFGLWSPESKQVPKFPVPGTVTDCCWSNNGHYLALALAIGVVSIRNNSGEEVSIIERANVPTEYLFPVFSVSFCPMQDPDNLQFIAIVDQSQTLSFYDMSGKQVGKEKALGYDGLSVRFSPTGEYLTICGSNKQACLYTKEGVFISSICQMESWVKCVSPNSLGTHVAVGSENGDIAVYELIVSTVHSLYKEHYACRISMTEVIIQHLISDVKVRIKCRDLVKNLAIYKNRVAIQLTDKIVIYELVPDKTTEGSPQTDDMHYKVRNKIPHKNDGCKLLVVGVQSVVLNMDKKLQCVNFDGIVEREWTLDSFCRYVHATGGPAGKEGILLGLRNGQVLQIFINNPFPILIVKLESPVRCLDMSMKRKRLAVVDDQGMCHIFDMTTKELLFHANTVSKCLCIDFIH